jgi:hypothetical protein
VPVMDAGFDQFFDQCGHNLLLTGGHTGNVPGRSGRA